MRKRLAVTAAATVAGFVLGVLLVSRAEGIGWTPKFLFTPQGGLNSACLSCGWHSGACGPTWGWALDFPASCSDGGQQVYFRNWGFKRSGSTEWVAWGTPFTVPGTTCKTTEVRIYDTSMNRLGTMLYTHTYKTRDADMMMYISQDGRRNEYVFAGMAKEPWLDQGIPESEKENWDCYNAGWWTGRHVHEQHANGTSTFFLRDDGSCSGRYPCGPQSTPYPTRNPQDWWNDWVRAFCIDDTDCDGWTDDEESYIGTDPLDACPDNSWDDAWPLDINNDRWITVGGDVLNFRGRIGDTGPPRYDLNADGFITVGGDALLYRGRIGETCT